MQTKNNTMFSENLCQQQPVEARCRNITLHTHPADPQRIISIGINESMKVIADEPRSQWQHELAKQ